jgi:hypothetical protein
MDDDEEEKEWHLDVKHDNIQDATNINMNEIKDEIDVEKIVKNDKYLFLSLTEEWSTYVYNWLIIRQCRMQITLIFVNHKELMNNLVSVSSSVQSWNR